jgi:hypothetical protein
MSEQNEQKPVGERCGSPTFELGQRQRHCNNRGFTSQADRNVLATAAAELVNALSIEDPHRRVPYTCFGGDEPTIEPLATRSGPPSVTH